MKCLGLKSDKDIAKKILNGEQVDWMCPPCHEKQGVTYECQSLGGRLCGGQAESVQESMNDLVRYMIEFNFHLI